MWPISKIYSFTCAPKLKQKTRQIDAPPTPSIELKTVPVSSPSPPLSNSPQKEKLPKDVNAMEDMPLNGESGDHLAEEMEDTPLSRELSDHLSEQNEAEIERRKLKFLTECRPKLSNPLSDVENEELTNKLQMLESKAHFLDIHPDPKYVTDYRTVRYCAFCFNLFK